MKKEIKLLSKSIDHWFENLMMLQLNKMGDPAHLGQDIHIYSQHCPLCQEYYIECRGCPIFRKKENESCAFTPWQHVERAMYFSGRLFHNHQEIYKAITDFLNFLIELKEELICEQSGKH